jgi:hypothetical protein
MWWEGWGQDEMELSDRVRELQAGQSMIAQPESVAHAISDGRSAQAGRFSSPNSTLRQNSQSRRPIEMFHSR